MRYGQACGKRVQPSDWQTTILPTSFLIDIYINLITMTVQSTESKKCISDVERARAYFFFLVLKYNSAMSLN